MSAYFTEPTYEAAVIELFTRMGYTHVYAPDLNKPRKRNYMRGVEHLLYSVQFPKQAE